MVRTFYFLALEFQPPYCLQAASWRENSINTNSFQEHNSTRMTQPRKSLSTSDLFDQTNQAKLSAIQTQYTNLTHTIQIHTQEIHFFRFAIQQQILAALLSLNLIMSRKFLKLAMNLFKIIWLMLWNMQELFGCRRMNII